MMMQNMQEMGDMCPPGMFPGMEADFLNITESLEGNNSQIQLRTHPSNCQINIGELGKKLLEAARNGDLDEVYSLVQAGAPFTTDWMGATPLHYACQFGHTETVRVLLESGCSKDARTKIERTALHVAAQEGFLSTCKMLVDFDCEIDPQDMLKMTPLHWAAQRGHKDVIEFLMKNGADVTSVSKFDKTPIDIAQNEGLHDYAPYMNTFEGLARPKRPSIPTPNLSQPIKIKSAFSNKRMKMSQNGGGHHVMSHHQQQQQQQHQQIQISHMQRSLSQNSNTATKFKIKEELEENSTTNMVYEAKAPALKPNIIVNANNSPKPISTITTTTPTGAKKLVAVQSGVGGKYLLVTNPNPQNGGVNVGGGVGIKNSITVNGKLKPISVSDLRTPVKKFEILSNGTKKTTTIGGPANMATTNVVKRIVINGQSVNQQNVVIQQKNQEIKNLNDEIKKMKREIDEYKELIISKDLEIEAMKKEKRSMVTAAQAAAAVAAAQTRALKDSQENGECYDDSREDDNSKTRTTTTTTTTNPLQQIKTEFSDNVEQTICGEDFVFPIETILTTGSTDDLIHGDANEVQHEEIIVENVDHSSMHDDSMQGCDDEDDDDDGSEQQITSSELQAELVSS